MKRIFTIITASMLAFATLQAQELNIYASGLTAGAVDNTNLEVNISYTLNAPATSLAVILQKGSDTPVELAITGAANLTKGAHTDVAVDLSDVPSGNYAWSIKAEGAATASEPVAISSTTNPFTTPRGLVIDKNTESPFFGRIYVSDSKNTATTGGVYVFDAAFADITNQGTDAWSQIFSGSSASPLRLTVAPDSRIYITDWSDNATSGVYIWDPAAPATNAIPVFGGTVGTGGIATEGGVSIHGSVSHCYVVGTGAETKLYTFDEDLASRVNLYEIGNLETPWIAAPTVVSVPSGIVNGNGMGLPDNNGGWWISQHRWADGAANPAVIHLNNGGIADYSSTAEFTADAAYNTRGAIALNSDQTLIASVGDNAIKIFEIAYANGVPTVVAPPKYKLTTTFASTCYSLDIDVAGNVYALGDAKALFAYALPKAENVFTTPAPAASTLEVINKGTGISDQVAAKTPKSVQYFDLTGKPVTEDAKGLVIKKTIYEDGSIENSKEIK